MYDMYDYPIDVSDGPVWEPEEKEPDYRKGIMKAITILEMEGPDHYAGWCLYQIETVLGLLRELLK